MPWGQIVGETIGTLFQDAPYYIIKRIGSFVRWLFLKSKYNYAQIYDQDWNGRVGILTILIIIFSIVGIKAKFYDPKHQLERSKSEVKEIVARNELKNGDIIFQTSLSRQSKAIQLATHSKYSHCGIIYKEGNSLYVFEAIQPVKMTPLANWIARGEDGHFVVKRLINAPEILSKETLAKMKSIGEGFIGKDYDLGFDWSDDKMYCSELIWKIYYRAAGIEVGELQKLNDFDLTEPIVKKKLKERYGEKIPKDESVISPASIFDSELLTLVKSN